MNESDIRISVVIPTLNREEPLCETLRYFLEKETYPQFEIIVIDQSREHAPRTQEFFRLAGSRIKHRIVDFRNLARARNEGVRMAEGNVIVFVDDDVTPLPGFLTAVAAAHQHPHMRAVTGPAPRPGQKLLSRGEIGEESYRRLVSMQEMRNDVSFSYVSSFAPGCNMSFRKELIHELGGFDENFYGVSIGEDAEFSHRVKKAGHSIYYVPSMHLVHHCEQGGGCRTDSQQKEYIKAVLENTHYFWFKVGDSRWHRCRMLYRIYRKHVCPYAKQHLARFLSLSFYFIRSLCASCRRIKHISKEPIYVHSH